MTNDDLSDRISLLEAEIDHLVRLAEGCRKIILISKIAIVLGALTLLATMLGQIKFDQLVFVGSITAILGGIVAAFRTLPHCVKFGEICAPPSNCETS